MKKNILFIIFILVFYVQNGYAQKLSFKVDSIKIYNLPLSLHTTISLDDYEVRNWNLKVKNKETLQIKTVSDSLDLKAFAGIQIMDNDNITSFNYSLDVRIVVDVYLEKGILISILMDNKGYYLIGNEKKSTIKKQRIK